MLTLISVKHVYACKVQSILQIMSDLHSQLLDAGIDILVSEKFGSDSRGALQNIYVSVYL